MLNSNQQHRYLTAKFVVLLVLTYGAIWLTHMNAVALTAPIDNLEQLVWVRSLEWGYYKHPPLPTWLLSTVIPIFGYSVFTTYILGAVITCLSLFVYWRLLLNIHGSKFAWIGLLAATCITLYCFRMYYYNHNVILLLCVVLTSYAFYKGITNQKMHWWVLLGLVGAAGMMTKYQYALVIAPILYVYLSQKLWRISSVNWGMTISVVIAGILLMPHAYWIFHAESSPINYAMRTSLGAHLSLSKSISWSLLWLVDLLFNRCIPALLFLGVVYWISRKNRIQLISQVDSLDKSYLIAWGVWPIAIMFAMGVLGGVDVQLQWGTGFALWVVPVAMYLFKLDRHVLPDRLLKPIFMVYLIFQLLLSYISFDKSAFGPHPSGHWNNQPSAQWAEELAKPAREQLHGSIKIISGDSSIAAAIAMQLPEKPKVLINGDLTVSPWISLEELKQGGVIELIPPDKDSKANRISNGWGWRIATF